MNVTRNVRSLYINRLFTFQSFVTPADQFKSGVICGIDREKALRLLCRITAVIVSRTPELVDSRLCRIAAPAPEVESGQRLAIAA